MRHFSMLSATLLLLAACTSYAPQDVAGVKSVDANTDLSKCELLGTVLPEQWAFNPWDAAKVAAKKMGGDTVHLKGVTFPADVYVCDPAKAAEVRAFNAKIAGVRVTNRQDVVTSCRFLKNVTTSSEELARRETVTAGGNVFYIVSDTSRTQTTKDYGQPAVTYEVRRLTGEVYACAP